MTELFASLQSAVADRYELERELGRGGMATVYLARDLRHPRRVALKVLRPELAGVMTRGRFLREIRISSDLVHPHILPLLDSGTVPPIDGFHDLPFYTMPYIEGESLQERLARERQLPVDDALTIARHVAEALGYAHGRGVVHRDIKPGNILLSDGHAIVADFGIARAVREAVDPDAVTSAGMVIGTPAYMSPEQAGAQVDVDGRSDIYSLGCVLYEMLGGEPPFSGATPQAVIARHRMDPAPSLRTLRASTPEPVERAIRRALEKSPADRFATAEEFADALRPGPSGAWPTVELARPKARRRTPTVVLLVALLAVAAWYLAGGPTEGAGSRAGTEPLDTTRYAILSFGSDSGVPAALRPALLLQDALARWGGVHLVDPFQVGDQVARRDTSGFRDDDWRRLAGELGAGRYIRVDAARVGDSIRVTAALYDATVAGSPAELRTATVRLPTDLASADAAFASLADSLLLGSPAPRAGQPAGQTRSLPARQAFEDGTSAINAWDLGTADASFANAVRFDPAYVQAHLWLALVRLWADSESPAAWRSPAERAVAGRAELSQRDQRIADAVLAQARGDLLLACRRWRELTDAYPHDFVVWYGLGTCLRQDRIVVRDARSPTRWRFRSSYHAALAAYERAYALFPSILRGLRADSYSRMVHLMLASGADFRGGQGLPPDPPAFFAFPSWNGDTLALFPVPVDPVTGISSRGTATTREAIARQRQRLHDLAVGWVAEFPASADALQALGVSLQLLGDRSALDTLIKAGRLARDPGEKVRVGTSEVWARVLFNAPEGVTELAAARRLADSLLTYAEDDGPIEPALLASLATLTGRASLASRLGRSVNSVDRMDTPPALVGIGISFLTYAALGGPRDSLASLAQRVPQRLESGVERQELPWAQETWLQLPILIGFPGYPFPQATGLAQPDGGLMAGYAAYLEGDSAGALRAVRLTTQAGAEGRTIDIGFGTAWLLAELGEREAAAGILDQVLTTLPAASPQLYLEVYQAGPLVRAMALRAELADRLGDRETARHWASAVVALWSGADAFLQPTVGQMRSLAQ